MIRKELDALKYELYKKSGKMDYLTFEQFKNNQKVAFTFSELQNREKKKKIGKKSEKRLEKGYKMII